ncbi:MAG: preprotein translocase subunit SecG [bacterium]|nr:preprotein translocase subunit SecG [bacterium]
MLYNLVLGTHVVVCFVLIVVVLMQSSKGGGLAGAFGGGGDQTVFGGQETASFLNRATTYLAVSFMLLSLLLAFLTTNRSAARPRSAMRDALRGQTNVIPTGTGESIEEILGGAATDSVATDTVPNP